jgi:hypothetical protein
MLFSCWLQQIAQGWSPATATAIAVPTALLFLRPMMYPPELVREQLKQPRQQREKNSPFRASLSGQAPCLA